jgi:hypothetical protein
MLCKAVTTQQQNVGEVKKSNVLYLQQYFEFPGKKKILK